MIQTIHGFSPPGEVQLCLMGGGVKGPAKAPAPSKLKKEVLGGSSCSDKLREPREPGPGRPEKLGETEVPATASTSNGAGPGSTENIKRKSRLEVKISLSPSQCQNRQRSSTNRIFRAERENPTFVSVQS